MSFQAMTWATQHRLPAMQKIVLLMMANRTNHETGYCYPSLELLAQECGMERRSVINQIAKLEALKLLKVVRTVSGKHVNQVNKYWLDLTAKLPDASSERDSLGVVKEIHQGSERDSLRSERDSLGVVKEIHQGSERDSPKTVNEPVIINQERKTSAELCTAQPVVIELPLNKKGEYRKITQVDVDYFASLYLAVDVLQELRGMLGWLNANPERRKTAKGIDNFINRWLAKKQDQGGTAKRPSCISSAAKAESYEYQPSLFASAADTSGAIDVEYVRVGS